MESKIAETLKLKYNPVGIYWVDEKPEKSIQFKKGAFSCVLYLFMAAVRGKMAAIDKETFGCVGGGVGMGFGNQYLNFPGGFDSFCRFLSTGNESSPQGKAAAGAIEKFVKKEFLEEFLQGERYYKSPELAKKFAQSLPITEIPRKYVLLKPIGKDVPGVGDPVVVVFLANPEQLSALVVLANYARESSENVIIPFAAGCQSIGIYPFREAQSDTPRAVVGLVDISARRNLKGLGRDLLTFAVPYGMFQEMEENVGGSFLGRPTWKNLQDG